MTLKFSLLSSLTILLILALALLGWYYYSSSSQHLLSVSDELIEQIGQSVQQETAEFFKPAITAVGLGRELTARLREFQINSDQRQQIIDRFCLRAIQASDQLSFVYYADEHGNYNGMEALPDGSLVRWRLREAVAAEEQSRRLDLYYLNRSNPELIERTERREEFDFYAPGRPWYLNAVQNRRLSWTDVYVFYSSAGPLLGITCSDLVQSQMTDTSPDSGLSESVGIEKKIENFGGVFAADLVLGDISVFLSELSIGKSGLAFIVNQHNQVVSFPDHQLFDEALAAADGVIPTLPVLGELGIPWLDEASREYLRRRSAENSTASLPLRFSHDFENKRYILSVRPLTGVFDDNWKIIIAVPEDDFIGAMKQTSRNILIVGLIILALTLLFIIAITNYVTRPVMKMVNHTSRLSQLYLDEPLLSGSPIYEVGILSESMEKMRKGLLAFGKFAPVDLIRRLMSSGSELEIGGTKRDLTIFFSDICGFTSITENMDAEQLMRHISEYLEQLTALITNSGGTIDKYIGDGIMAFWGAPDENPRHADTACLAALKCQREVTRLNGIWEAAGKPRLETRIGIASGETIVGNLGSSDRISYSVIGDSVNLASRLEGVNKIYRTTILISQLTYSQLTPGHFLTRPVDQAQIRGKTEPVQIYELLAARLDDGSWLCPGMSVQPLSEASAEFSALANLSREFAEIFALYLDRRWDEALKQLQALPPVFVDDYLVIDFSQRCRHWRDNPPPADWTGVRPGFRSSDL